MGPELEAIEAEEQIIIISLYIKIAVSVEMAIFYILYSGSAIFYQ